MVNRDGDGNEENDRNRPGMLMNLFAQNDRSMGE